MEHHDRQTAPGLREWFKSASLQDLFTGHHHSQDFNGSRAGYITVRVRLLALLFAILAPLWIPIDHLFMTEEQFLPFRYLRIGFSICFFILAMIDTAGHSLLYARLRLFVFLLIPSIFYVLSRKILGGGLPEEGILAGYSFLPFLMIVFMAIFPLTLLEGLVYAAFVIAVFLGTEYLFGTLWHIQVLGDVWLLALLAGITLWAQLAQLHMLLRLYREAAYDALTGLVNRRVLTKWLDVQIRHAKENNNPLSVLLFDLDLFKRINDTYGHLTGDAVLQRFSRLLSSKIFEPNLIGRYGGEEFLAILPGKDEDHAIEMAERIRQACRHIRVESSDGEEVRFSVSIGVTQLNDNDDSQSLIKRVDQGLYLAKESGRDLVARAQTVSLD